MALGQYILWRAGIYGIRDELRYRYCISRPSSGYAVLRFGCGVFPELSDMLVLPTQ